MARYIAKVDIPPHIKKGDEVRIDNPLIPEFAERLTPVVDEDDSDSEDDDKTIVTNPDRNSLKARATQLGINFASNIPTDRLVELITEAEEKAKTDEGSGDEGSGDEGSDDEDGNEE